MRRISMKRVEGIDYKVTLGKANFSTKGEKNSEQDCYVPDG